MFCVLTRMPDPGSVVCRVQTCTGALENGENANVICGCSHSAFGRAQARPPGSESAPNRGNTWGERGEGGGVEEAWVMRADAPVASRRALAERSNRPPEHNERRRNGGVGKEAVQRKVA